MTDKGREPRYIIFDECSAMTEQQWKDLEIYLRPKTKWQRFKIMVGVYYSRISKKITALLPLKSNEVAVDIEDKTLLAVVQKIKHQYSASNSITVFDRYANKEYKLTLTETGN